MPLSQVVEVDETRQALHQDVFDGLARPQILVRVGWSESHPHAPRPHATATGRRSDRALTYMPTYVRDFAEGDRSQSDLLGGKGANLAEMCRLGLPVPPGFTITTEACRAYLRDGAVPDGLDSEVGEHLARLERHMDRRLGDRSDPLLVSVRSGSKFSMPGMMETVLDVGLNDESVHGLARHGGERFALDSYRRLIQMFGSTVLGIEPKVFATALAELKDSRSRVDDAGLDVDDLRELVSTYQALVLQYAGRGFPQDPREQLDLAVRAVFDSWHTPRAAFYRQREHISEDSRHGRQRAGDGLRQPRFVLRLRGGVHARPGHGRQRRVRRLPAARTGRGRRLRHPQHGAPG